MNIKLSESELQTVIRSLRLAADRYRENVTALSVPNDTQSNVIDRLDRLILTFSHQEQDARKLATRLETEQTTKDDDENNEVTEDLERTIETWLQKTVVAGDNQHGPCLEIVLRRIDGLLCSKNNTTVHRFAVRREMKQDEVRTLVQLIISRSHRDTIDLNSCCQSYAISTVFLADSPEHTPRMVFRINRI